jgi:hypothetical protein
VNRKRAIEKKQTDIALPWHEKELAGSVHGVYGKNTESMI